MQVFTCPGCFIVFDYEQMPIDTPNKACSWQRYFQCPVCKKEQSVHTPKEFVEQSEPDY